MWWFQCYQCLSEWGMPFTTGPAAEVVTYNGWLTAQCWECGNVTYPPGQFTSIDECEKPCLGNATEFCGGSARALLYSNLPQFVFPSGGWSTRGCVITLSNINLYPHSCKSIDCQGCIDACIASGFNSAGLYDGQQCCVFVDDNECNVACGGDPFQICGGQDRMLLRRVWMDAGSPGGWKQGSSWGVNVVRPLPVTVLVTDLNFTGCANTTDAGGNIGTLATPAECLTTPCTGAINEACGGVDRVLVYQFKGQGGAGMLSRQPM
ncbi:hypothetical protein BD779DRAFT_1514574 [Infundibulicybe gibba]|nr:hypothetical protein BD779DRAFT_1514574 [Infundibulicybe gibba]